MIRQLLKRFEPKANKYLLDKQKTQGLLTKASSKAVENRTGLKGIYHKLQLLFEAIKAWKSGVYPHFPKKSLVMIVAAILYFLAPIDLIPDFLLGFGIVDDAAVLAFVVKHLGKDLEQFEKWKEIEDKTIEIHDSFPSKKE
ncbi:YkvA family protein [Metabacillus herbersteinensis]|uniref:YkvA family protein n=1 Tax=Metabacillus herbersteinensis TaxID=283816 RepID=A0ABV6GBE9_9BACI